jgi:hypothetical protein
LPKCRYCGLDKKLIKAHVIPESFWDTKNEGKGPLALVFADRPERVIPSYIGPYDSNILCEECDNTLGLLDQHAAEKLLTQRAQPYLGSSKIHYYPMADSWLLTKFMLSVAWRASVSKTEFFSEVNLGPFENAFLDIVKNQNAKAGVSLCVLTEVENEPPTISPQHTRLGDVRVLLLSAARFQIYIKTDSRPWPSEYSQLAIDANKPVLTLMRKDIGPKHLRQYKQVFAKITRPRFWKPD